jgi:hypothetical protein
MNLDDDDRAVVHHHGPFGKLQPLGNDPMLHVRSSPRFLRCFSTIFHALPRGTRNCVTVRSMFA